jgi:hypothetical protein
VPGIHEFSKTWMAGPSPAEAKRVERRAIGLRPA